uniref:ORF49 n=1 Tax=Malaco herpesvirus 2 TaxID=3031798 RepID=A0AA48P8W5_9VIRU|nr:TPA_asm: ORF49 [Malaco herpesvirus 2]
MSIKPIVVRLKRKNGTIVQDCDLYIGREIHRGGWNLPQSDWANPFTIERCGSAKEAVRCYENYIRNKRPDLLRRIPELDRKTLGCWCKPGPCHGDILIKLFEEYQSKNEFS